MQVVKRRMSLMVVALASVAAMQQPAFAQDAGTSSPPAAATQQLPNFTVLVQRAAPAVVNISTTREASSPRGGMNDQQIPEIFRRFFGDQLPPGFGGPGGGATPRSELRSLGSGFIISDDGYILTNAHVVADADTIRVRLNDRRELDAELIGTDPKTDVALIKVDASDLPVLSIGNSDELQTGEWVAAIGSPFGFDHSVTAGIVSAINRTLPSDAYVPFIQTDVAINPGNSGGPLFNLQGQVVGINSQIFTRSGGFMGLSFAIPINVAMDIADQLRQDGRVHRGWLGVVIQPVSRDLADSFGLGEPRGALISQLASGGPAAQGGLRPGDIVLSVDGREVESSEALPREIGRATPGSEVTLGILRDGSERSLKVTVGDWPDSEQTAQSDSGSAQQSGIGIAVSPLNPEQLEEAGVEHGVLVQQVVPDGAAAQAGIQPGDVIIDIDRQAIDSVDKLREVIADLPRDRAVAVRIARGDAQLFTALRMGSGE